MGALRAPTIALGLLLAPVSAQETGAPAKPNVVVFLVDDLGWADVACNGSRVYRTPNVDRLARQGVRFTNAYASHPMCKASRYSLFTGHYAARAPFTDDTPAAEHTWPRAMKEGGYATFFAGKWHVAIPQEESGFDVMFATNAKGATASHFYPYGRDGHPNRIAGLEEDGEPGEYLTDRLTDETIGFIEANRERPFFVYLSHYAVHRPLEARSAAIESSAARIAETEFEGPATEPVGSGVDKRHQDNATYAAMVESVDESLGRIVGALEALGLADETIVVFTSDNGGASCNAVSGGHNNTSNAPLKGGKCWLYEGGIRVPLIVRGAPGARAGATSDAVVVGADHYPTVLELVGLHAGEAELDGVSYVPALAGRPDWERPAAFWHFPISARRSKTIGAPGAGSVIREGSYKLVEWYESGEYELYDLSSDPGERHDLREEQPERARELLAALRKWRKDVDAPLRSDESER